MTALEQLMKIPAFGKQIFQGNNYMIKLRKNISPELDTKLVLLKRKYPELLVHKTLKQTVIFGGTFSSASNFMYEVKLMAGLR